jgi:ABC-2 type transport system ATP-binding protein
VVLVAGRVAVDGEVDQLLACHHRLVGPRRDPAVMPPGQSVIEQSHVDHQTMLLVRSEGPILDPAWVVTPVSLDDLVLAYLRMARDGVPASPTGLVVAP